jgi:hypothetical protein
MVATRRRHPLRLRVIGATIVQRVNQFGGSDMRPPIEDGVLHCLFAGAREITRRDC